MQFRMTTADNDHVRLEPHSPGYHALGVSGSLGAHMVLLTDDDLATLVSGIAAAAGQ